MDAGALIGLGRRTGRGLFASAAKFVLRRYTSTRSRRLTTDSKPNPIAAGVVLAAVAAVAFGVTTPIVAWAGRELGPFSTAALLYAGAGSAALLSRLFSARLHPRLRRTDLGRVLIVAVIGGAVAPTLLAWGLQRTGATLGALLLNLEAVFTVLLARALYREPIGARVAVAVMAMALGGVALTLEAWQGASWGLLGALAVAGATAAWATDNTLTRPLAERDPIDVVAGKGVIGAAITAGIAFAIGEPMPAIVPVIALLICGATGYGLSLRLYLLAQRKIGAGRTGSVFALAPFIGASVGYALGDRHPTAWTIGAVALFAIGVYLHATERHAHRHAHEPIEHDHVHGHDDDHHHHHHDPPVVGQHAHPHHHDQMEHDHEHAPDVHHHHPH